MNDNTPAIEKLRCAACGKSITQGKSGSLTQWIFKDDACSCSRPEPIESRQDDFKQPAFVGFDELENEPELVIEEEKFPFDRYKPISILGRGESGAVYLSRDRLLGKRVAVKVLRKCDREALLSFQNEAKTTSKLTHSNIIRILDFGCTSGGTPYMVMDYVKGSTLEAYLKVNDTLDLKRCVTIFTNIAEALEYAHDAAILHRDIKPSNIMVSQDDGQLHASLIDFGVAKMQAHFENTTQIDGTALVGTPAYMSPDQAIGREFDHRSDIYSLGCVFFECLTGRLPYLADSPLETISMHAHEEIPSLFDLYPSSDTIAYLDEIIHKCLKKDPDQRYSNVKEFRAALQEIPALKRWDQQSAQMHAVPNQATLRRLSPLVIVILGCLCILVSSLAWYLISPDNLSDKSAVSDARRRDDGIISLDNSRLDVTSGVDRDLKELRSYPNPIESVHFMDCKITAQGLKYIQKKKIKDISVDTGSEVSDSLVKGISKLTDLRKVHLATKRRIAPATLGLLADIPELEELYLTNMLVDKETFKALAKCTHLQNLKLQDCPGIDREGLQQLKELPSLNAIELSMSHISAQIIDGLSDLPQLKMLDLSGTDVSEKDLFRLESSKSLQHLSLLFCPNISKEAVESFSKRTKVDVYSNSDQTQDVWSKSLKETLQY
ncbi:MAG: protein kinase [Candidatus Obscuribacterales bacterium]|nr:protein kinase [Candidatus Obscuribacterales bacterium]